MNATTREELKKFIKAVSDMAYWLVPTVGEDVSKPVIERGHFLSQALDKDETIP